MKACDFSGVIGLRVEGDSPGYGLVTGKVIGVYENAEGELKLLIRHVVDQHIGLPRELILEIDGDNGPRILPA